MKIADIILEYGNAPNNSSDPKLAGGVPNAVGNLKARRLARNTPATPSPSNATQPATPATVTPAQTVSIPASRSPIDDLLDAPDEQSTPAKKQTSKDNYIDKLGNIFNRYADGKSYAVGNFANDNKDTTTGYELNKPEVQQSYAAQPKQSRNSVTFPKHDNQPSKTYTRQGNAWVDSAGNSVTDANLLQAINAQAKA